MGAERGNSKKVKEKPWWAEDAMSYVIEQMEPYGLLGLPRGHWDGIGERALDKGRKSAKVGTDKAFFVHELLKRYKRIVRLASQVGAN